MFSRSPTLFRINLWPHAGAGFDVRSKNFAHLGQAIKFARTSLRVPVWKLGWVSGMRSPYLPLVERGVCHPTRAELDTLETYLGVKLCKRNKSRIDKAV